MRQHSKLLWSLGTRQGFALRAAEVISLRHNRDSKALGASPKISEIGAWR